MNILITSAGRRVSLVKAFQNELKRFDKNAKVFAADADPVMAAACHEADGFFKVPLVSDPNYLKELIAKCEEREIKLLIPTIDTELHLLARMNRELTEKGIQAVISTMEFIKICRDKRLTHDFFRSQDIGVAREFDKEDFTLPIFIKPADGSRSVDTFLIRKKSELREYHFSNDKLMFLEYLDHDHFDEYTCDLYYDRSHKLRCVVPRKRLEVRDGEVNKGLAIRNELVPYIRERLSEIPGARGCLTTQFFKHKSNHKIVGIEINPRFGGGFPLTYLAGANYPRWIIEEYLQDKQIDDQFDSWNSNLLMLRYDNEVLVHGYNNKQ